MADILVLNQSYDPRAAFGRAVLDLLKLDATGCEIAALIAEAWSKFPGWSPVEPGDSEYDRADGGDQFEALRDLAKAMIDDHLLAAELERLARSRQQTQQEIEAEEAKEERNAKRRRRRREARASAPVVPLH
jgi:hypothetical protein